MAPRSRPRVHHSPASGWVNDPLGLTYHEHVDGGRYHLFFQYVPGRTTWDVACCWGHATSTDLLHWTPEPVALEPGDGEDGVWSGSLVVTDEGEPTIFYTAVAADDRELGWVRRAVATDANWRTWAKQEVVVRLPEGEPAVAFRDPFVQRHGDGWRMLVGGGLVGAGPEGGVPVVWSFTSPDLRTWTYAGRAVEGEASTGAVWECPLLVDVDGRTALLVAAGGLGSPSHAAYSWVTEEGDRLVPGPWRRLSYGPAYYAASAFADAAGRPGLVHWLREVADEQAGWAGAHSLPHLLTRDGDRLVAGPHPALDAASAALDQQGSVVDLGWEPKGGDELVVAPGLVLGVAGDVLTVRAADRAATMPWSGGRLRVVLDGPVVEVFGDDGVLALPTF